MIMGDNNNIMSKYIILFFNCKLILACVCEEVLSLSCALASLQDAMLVSYVRTS